MSAVFSMVDTETGNLGSIATAFRRIGVTVEPIDRPEQVDAARILILPGVGAFRPVMERLEKKGLVEPIRRFAREAKRPLIGICLGMQLLAEASEEHGEHKGLGLIGGRVVMLRPDRPQFRVPNIGWYDLAARHALFHDGSFYFVHSYALACDDPSDVAATISYGSSTVTAAVVRGNTVGVQFHPEKSQDDGLDLLTRFRDFALEAA